MTVITRALAEKKSDTMHEPLVENIVVEPNDEVKKADIEGGGYPVPPQTTRYIISARVRPYYSLMFILMLVLLVATSLLGIFGTEYLYEQYKYLMGAEQQPGVYRAWGTISYDNPSPMAFENKISARFEKSDEPEDSVLSEIQEATAEMEQYAKNLLFSQNQDKEQQFENTLKENFEFDDRHEKIDLPSNNNNRFVHDFYSNYTAIVDVENRRCFIMPLDRNIVVPPKSLSDLFFKVTNRYYAMDIEKVRRDMRVQEPITDTESLGIYINKECEKFDTFKLEKVIGGVVKRNIENSETFTYFDGKNILEIVVRGISEPMPKAVP